MKRINDDQILRAIVNGGLLNMMMREDREAISRAGDASGLGLLKWKLLLNDITFSGCWVESGIIVTRNRVRMKDFDIEHKLDT